MTETDVAIVIDSQGFSLIYCHYFSKTSRSENSPKREDRYEMLGVHLCLNVNRKIGECSMNFSFERSHSERINENSNSIFYHRAAGTNHLAGGVANGCNVNTPINKV